MAVLLKILLHLVIVILIQAADLLRLFGTLQLAIDITMLCAAMLITCHLRLDGQTSVKAEPPQANPARPTVSTPATLTPIGYLQFENGILYARDSVEFASRSGVNQVTKLTVAPGWNSCFRVSLEH
jgi:hypothetical protein